MYEEVGGQTPRYFSVIRVCGPTYGWSVEPWSVTLVPGTFLPSCMSRVVPARSDPGPLEEIEEEGLRGRSSVVTGVPLPPDPPLSRSPPPG